MHKHDPALDIDEAGIKQLLRQGRLLLLVDGVNELPSDRGRVMVNQFRELYQKTCPMIFTTRELSAGGDLGIVKRLEMQPLTEPQMQQFVMAYLPTQGERLLRQLSGRLREFGQTPLLLWMLCELFQQSEQIPENLGKVFQVFTQTYENSSVRNHEVAAFKNNVQPLSDRRIWKDALKHLASKMMQGNSPIDFRTVISKDEIIQEFKLLFKDELQPLKLARDCLDDLLDYHLIQIRNEDKVEFRHQLIQEYYAAEWLLGLLPSLSDARLQQGYLNYLKWTEPLALMLELVVSEEQAVRVVRLALEVDLRLGARLAGAVKYGFQGKTVGLLLREIDERKIFQLDAIELLSETASDKAVETPIFALKDSVDYVRWNAAEALGKIGSDKAVEPLILALKDSVDYVRRNATEALGKIGSDKAVEHLILALKDSDNYVRWKAAEALGKIGSDKAVESLILALKDSDNYVRWNAAEALGKIGSDKAIEPLILALKDSDNDVRWNAAMILGKIGSDKAIEPLILALKDSDNFVSFNAVFELIKIGSDKVVEPLLLALKDSDNDVRWKALEVLSSIGSDKVVEPLLLALKDSDNDVRRKAAEALGKIGSDRAVEPLLLALKDSDNDVRRKAAEALGKIGSDRAVEPLLLALKDSDNDVRRKAAEALGKIGSDKTFEPLILALKDSDDFVRLNAAEALGKIGSDKAFEPLILALKDSDNHVRWNAAEALGKIGSDRAVEPLILALKDSDDLVRWFAAEALGKIGSDKAVEPLILALKDSDNPVRRNATEALGKIGSDKAVEPLILALKDSDNDVRRNAAMILGKIGSDKAIEPLLLALKDSDNDVRRNAAMILGKIGNDRAIEPLLLALKDSSYFLRKNAAEALSKINEADRNLPTLTQQLPHLLTLIPTESSQQALSVITAIQARCKYYNYGIYNTALQETENYANPVEKILQEIHQTLKTMSETGKYDIKAEVVQIVEKNYGQVIGKNSGQAIGKNYANDPSLLQTINEITQVLANLQKAHPTATEAEAKDIIEAEFKEIQNNQPDRWTTFRQQLLNPERWLNGGKATISEIAKHYAENSVFLKAGVAFLDGFSADEE
jgi:HEAT repeat protein